MAPRILLVRLSSLGDVILTTPLLRAIRTRHPDAEIAYLTRPAFAPLLADHPARPDVLTFNPATESLRQLADRLRPRQFTHLLDLHGVTRTLMLRALLRGNWRGYSKRRLARWTLVHLKRNLYRDNVPEPERFFEAARELDVVPDGRPAEVGIAADASSRAAGWLASRALGSRPMVAVAPGAAHQTKRWPVDYWERLVQLLTDTGFDVAVLTGADYAAAGAAIAAAGGSNAASTAGALGLQETAAICRSSSVVVAGDTGLMHLATAVGAPVVAFFGPTVRAFGFFPYRARTAILERELACRPCSAQGGPRCPLGHHHCLREITPDIALAAIRSLTA